ncbi:MAG: ADP-ribose diphosphatase [Methylococcus sp.]|nr:MAG: ADP-ribose diphosphatase [Methylococcus sp.]
MSSGNRCYKMVRETTVFKGYFEVKRFSIRHSLYDGGWSEELDREIFVRGNCVAVLPYDPVRDQVVLIEQFRAGALLDKAVPWLLEIVAGAIETGEDAIDVAYRETVEEAGCSVENLIRIAEFYVSPGTCSEKLTVFCGQVDSREASGVHGLEEEGEDILVSVVDFDQAMEKVASGEIDSATPIISLQWLALNRNRLRREWC